MAAWFHVSALHAAATDLAQAVSRCDVAEWDRPPVLGTRVVTVREVLERACHEAAHRVLDVDALLTATAVLASAG